MEARAAEGYTVATDLADAMIAGGATAREAHAAVGERVLLAERQGRALDCPVVAFTGSDDHEVSLMRIAPWAQECTGRFDYQLRVACRDADDLNHTVRTIRREAGAAGTETRIVLRSSSFERGISG